MPAQVQQRGCRSCACGRACHPYRLTTSAPWFVKGSVCSKRSLRVHPCVSPSAQMRGSFIVGQALLCRAARNLNSLSLRIHTYKESSTAVYCRIPHRPRHIGPSGQRLA